MIAKFHCAVQRRHRHVLAGAAIAAAASGCMTPPGTPAPDLVVAEIAGAEETGTDATRLIAAYTVRNIGTAAATRLAGAAYFAEVELFLATDGGPERYALTTTLAAPGVLSLAAGATARNVDVVTAGEGAEPGPRFTRICAVIDPADVVNEINEANNQACAPFPSAGRPDLVITRAVATGAEEASARVEIEIRNLGTGAALPEFPVRARTTSPREPSGLLITDCALTPAQRSAGGPAPCGSPFAVDPLGPGETLSFTAFVTFPSDRASGATETVEFVVDGCDPAREPGLTGACRVEESDEDNNSAVLTLTSP